MRKAGAVVLFVFAFLSAAGGLVAVLQYFKVKPEELTMAIPHLGWLMLAIALFCASVVTAGYSAYVTFRHGNRSSTPARGEPPPYEAPRSPADQKLLDKARNEFYSLQFGQRVALRLVYNSPGQFAGVYAHQLETLGFRDGEGTIRPLMAGILIDSSPQLRLSQSPRSFIAQLVEEEMAKPGWAGI